MEKRNCVLLTVVSTIKHGTVTSPWKVLNKYMWENEKLKEK